MSWITTEKQMPPLAKDLEMRRGFETWLVSADIDDKGHGEWVTSEETFSMKSDDEWREI